LYFSVYFRLFFIRHQIGLPINLIENILGLRQIVPIKTVKGASIFFINLFLSGGMRIRPAKRLSIRVILRKRAMREQIGGQTPEIRDCMGSG
jgi:hypothetical protein